MGTKLKPSQIYFSHIKISSNFTGCGNPLAETLQDLIDGKITVENIPKIKVYYFQTSDGIKYLSENNRRLWVFKQLESMNLIDNVSVRLEKSSNKKHQTNQYSLRAKIKN